MTKCCICKKKITNLGNNPNGAVNNNNETIKWRVNDVCCDECDLRYVIPGRMAITYNINLNKYCKVTNKKVGVK